MSAIDDLLASFAAVAAGPRGHAQSSHPPTWHGVRGAHHGQELSTTRRCSAGSVSVLRRVIERSARA